jgi:ABC-2 type transport system ATP-binding protein
MTKAVLRIRKFHVRLAQDKTRFEGRFSVINNQAGNINAMSHRPSATYRGETPVRAVKLTKVFGANIAVDSLDLEIRTGEVLGFLGPNGAGKTTAINMILGLLQPTSGHVELFGEKADWTQSEMRKRIGALLDGVELYPYLSAKENLQVFRRALGGIPERRIGEVLETVDLTSRANDRVSGFSQGMKRRLGLALSLLPDPDMLILDEPANGLDPEGIKDLRDLLKGLARRGKGVFLSSHLLHEVEVICDRVVILRKGKVIAQGKVTELITETPEIELAVERPGEAEKIILAKPEVSSVSRNGNRLLVQYNSSTTDVHGTSGSLKGLDNYQRLAQQLNEDLASHGVFVHELIPHRGNLEEVFFDVVKEVK